MGNSKKVKIEVEYVPDEDRYKDILANYKMKNPKSQQNSNILNTIPTQKQHTTNHWHNKNQSEINQKSRQNSNILNTILTQKQHVTKYIKNQPEKQTLLKFKKRKWRKQSESNETDESWSGSIASEDSEIPRPRTRTNALSQNGFHDSHISVPCPRCSTELQKFHNKQQLGRYGIEYRNGFGCDKCSFSDVFPMWHCKNCNYDKCKNCSTDKFSKNTLNCQKVGEKIVNREQISDESLNDTTQRGAIYKRTKVQSEYDSEDYHFSLPKRKNVAKNQFLNSDSDEPAIFEDKIPSNLLTKPRCYQAKSESKGTNLQFQDDSEDNHSNLHNGVYKLTKRKRFSSEDSLSSDQSNRSFKLTPKKKNPPPKCDDSDSEKIVSKKKFIKK